MLQLWNSAMWRTAGLARGPIDDIYCNREGQTAVAARKTTRIHLSIYLYTQTNERTNEKGNDSNRPADTGRLPTQSAAATVPFRLDLALLPESPC